MTTSLDTNADIQISEALLSEDKDWLEDLQTENLRLDKVEGDTVYTDHALAGLAVGNGGGGLLATIALNGIAHIPIRWMDSAKAR